MFFDSAMVGLRISPAAVVGDNFANGGDDRVAKLGMRGEAIEDGLVNGGPKFVFGGRIVGVGRDQKDLVLGRVSRLLFRDFRGGQEVPVEVRLVVWVAIRVEELVVVDVVVVLHRFKVSHGEDSRRDQGPRSGGEVKLLRGWGIGVGKIK